MRAATSASTTGLGVHGRDPRRDHAVELVGVRVALGGVAELRARVVGVGAHQLEDADDLRVDRPRDHDPARVARPVDVARRRDRDAAPRARRRRLTRRPRDHGGAEELQDGFVDAHVDELAGTAPGVTPVERGEHARDPEERAHVVADRHRRQHRRAVGLAGHVGEASVGFEHRAVARPLGVGSVRAEAGHQHDDRARVARLDLVVGAAPSFEHALWLVQHDDVGDCREALDDLDAVGGVEVDAQRALVAVGECPDERAVAAHGTGDAQRVAAGWLHLHDVGTQIAEHRGDHRSRKQRGEVEHAHPGQGRRGCRLANRLGQGWEYTVPRSGRPRSDEV